MGKFKTGDKVIITGSWFTGKIVTVEREYSNITGFYEIKYTVRNENKLYMYFYCSEDKLIPITGNELLSILYGVKED